jgi:uncharacterized membrane protein
MSNAILVIGESGTGKTTSVETLPPEETVIFLTEKEDLPFRGWKKNYIPLTKEGKGNLVKFKGIEPGKVAEQMVATMTHVDKNMPHIKYLIIDDYIYTMVNEYMDRAKEKSFDKFTDLALKAHNIANKAKAMREDLNVAILTHSEETQDSSGIKKQKIKTLGKLLDNNVNLEGMFNVVLYTNIETSAEGNKYWFLTQNQNNTGKTPKGMFEDMKIPNDLKLVFDQINKYYND